MSDLPGASRQSLPTPKRPPGSRGSWRARPGSNATRLPCALPEQTSRTPAVTPDYQKLKQYLMNPPPRVARGVRGEMVAAQPTAEDGERWAPGDPGSMQPEVVLRLTIWLLEVFARLLPEHDERRREWILFLARLFRARLSLPLIALGTRFPDRFEDQQPLARRYVALCRHAWSQVRNGLPAPGGGIETVRIAAVLSRAEQVALRADESRADNSAATRREADLELWMLFRTFARYVNCIRRLRRGRSAAHLDVLALSFWKVALRTVPIASAVVPPRRRRPLPAWEWDFFRHADLTDVMATIPLPQQPSLTPIQPAATTPT